MPQLDTLTFYSSNSFVYLHFISIYIIRFLKDVIAYDNRCNSPRANIIYIEQYRVDRVHINKRKHYHASLLHFLLNIILSYEFSHN